MRTKLYILGLALCLAVWLFLLAFIPPAWACEKPIARVFILQSPDRAGSLNVKRPNDVLSAADEMVSAKH